MRAPPFPGQPGAWIRRLLWPWEQLVALLVQWVLELAPMSISPVRRRLAEQALSLPACPSRLMRVVVACRSSVLVVLE